MTATIPAPAAKPPPPGPAVHLASGTRLCLFPAPHPRVRAFKTEQHSRAVSLPAADKVVGSSRWGKILKRKQPLAGKEHPSSWGGSAAARPTLPGPTPTANLGTAGLPCSKEPVSRESWAPGGHSWAASLRNSEAQNLENVTQKTTFRPLSKASQEKQEIHRSVLHTQVQTTLNHPRRACPLPPQTKHVTGCISEGNFQNIWANDGVTSPVHRHARGHVPGALAWVRHGSSPFLRPIVTPHVKQRSVEFPELFGTWRPRNSPDE